MFKKQGTALAAIQATSLDSWNAFKMSKTATLNENIIIANVETDCIYLHGTILASVDLEDKSKHYIKKEAEKYINDNGDSFPKDEVLKHYGTFKTHAKTYVEHDQGPEKAKGKCVDVVLRDMGDTVLIDVLFTIDKVHEDLIHNVDKKYVTHLSMGCQTEYTLCSICGNLAHNEKEYCSHIKTQKKQVIKADDGQMRKVAELCFNNTWVDVSLVMNPAFGGAAIRRVLSADEMGRKVLAGLMIRNMENEADMLKAASVIANTTDVDRKRDDIESPVYEPYHPIINDTSDDELPPEGYKPITWDNPHDVKDDFDRDNPGNESRVEGPMNALVNNAYSNWKCLKCGNQYASFKTASKESLITRCQKCGYAEEVDVKLAHESISTVERVVGDLITSNYKKAFTKDDFKTLTANLKNIDTNTLSQQIIDFVSGSKVANTEMLMKQALRGQVTDMVNDIVKQFKNKIVPKRVVEKYSEGYKFLVKELTDALTDKGYKVASLTESLKQATEIIEKHANVKDLETANSICEAHAVNSSNLKMAIANFDDIDSAEVMTEAAVQELESIMKQAVDMTRVEEGLQDYIEKINQKWKKNDTSEYIRDKYPDEWRVILDEARKQQYW